MKHSLLLMLVSLLLVLSSFPANAQASYAQDSCQLFFVYDLQSEPFATFTLGKQERLEIPSGENVLRLSCHLSKQSVFSFDQGEVIGLEANGLGFTLQRLTATSPAFLLPSGAFSAEFTLSMHNSDSKVFIWQSLERFLDQSLLNSITMGGFYGLCLVLILYVSFMGKMLGDKSFQLYSFYVFCASTFFLLQEGQLHIFFPEKSFLFDHQLYVLFAGLTVLSATLFIVRITEIHHSWPKITQGALYPSASIVLLIATYVLFAGHNGLANIIGSFMAPLTLLIMFTILVLVMIQSYRGVNMAWLVCVSLILMFVAMVVRVLPIDVGEFLERYGLIVAFAIEAFIFAIVVSSRIEHIKNGKLLAENQANTDVLCNVLNRRGWLAQAEELLSLQKKQGGVIGLLYIDLNDFKATNDSYGHHAGDKVLSIIANIIRSEARETDVVGRVGGDEFVVAGYFKESVESYGIAKRLRTRLNDMTLQLDEGLQVPASASVGHVLFDSPPLGVTQMLHMADKSMYENKRDKMRGNSPLAQP
ncbi:diguanylate cyclase [Glaciecola sp. SC05]|uniref:sensor domain-containing diguanylate cyclase n=1 Tax=Glaciecola sp. SC05 TaxID=1987355 RepID=UPI003527D1DF